MMEIITAKEAIFGLANLVFGLLLYLAKREMSSVNSSFVEMKKTLAESNSDIHKRMKELHDKFEQVEKDLGHKIDSDIEKLRKEFNNLLDKHYATNGDLNTLKSDIGGDIKEINSKLSLLIEKRLV